MFDIDIVQQNLRDQAQDIVGEANISVGGCQCTGRLLSQRTVCYHTSFEGYNEKKDCFSQNCHKLCKAINPDSSRSCPSWPLHKHVLRFQSQFQVIVLAFKIINGFFSNEYTTGLDSLPLLLNSACSKPALPMCCTWEPSVWLAVVNSVRYEVLQH